MARRLIPDHEFHCGFEPTTIAQHYIGKMTEDKCSNCKASHFRAERTAVKMNKPDNTVEYSVCCKAGEVKRPPISSPFPPLIKQLLKRDHMTPKTCKEIADNMRVINGRLSFASLCTTQPEIKLPGRGPYVFKVQGTFMRRISSAVPADGYQAQYSQLYFLDPAEARRQLLRHPMVEEFSPGLKERMAGIHNLLREINPFARAYKMMQNYCDSLIDDGQEIPDLTLVFNHGDKMLDKRRHIQNPSSKCPCHS